ncbi:MAG: LamG-like jellyroll fold domain-containing protein [Microthrixaceae bacterium]
MSSGSAAFGSVGLITTSGDASVEISAGGKLDCGVYSFAGGSSVSLEGWFRADSLPSTGWKVAALAGTDSLYLVGGRVPRVEVHTSTGAIAVQGSTRVAVGEAHHLVGTYDGSHVRIFVDGVLSAVQTKTGCDGFRPVLDLRTLFMVIRSTEQSTR